MKHRGSRFLFCPKENPLDGLRPLAPGWENRLNSQSPGTGDDGTDALLRKMIDDMEATLEQKTTVLLK